MIYRSSHTFQPREWEAFTRVGEEKEKKKVMATNKCNSSVLSGKLFLCDCKLRKFRKNQNAHK